MIRPDQVWLAVEPVDMRMGIDGLSLKVQQGLGHSPCDDTTGTYQYDELDNLQVLTTNTGIHTYTYDEINRLDQESGPTGARDHAYDANGNRSEYGQQSRWQSGRFWSSKLMVLPITA